MHTDRAVVFDLGRVLVDYDYSRLFGYFADHGLRLENDAELLARSRLVDYECGRIDSAAFFSHLAGLMPVGPEDNELRRRWIDIFSPAQPMLGFARSLNERAPVFLLSNVSSAHFQYLRDAFDLDSVARGILTSYEAGCMKPDTAIYRAAQAKFGLAPEAILFVDDAAANVDGARRCGWSAIHHTDPTVTMATVEAWLGSSHPETTAGGACGD